MSKQNKNTVKNTRRDSPNTGRNTLKELHRNKTRKKTAAPKKKASSLKENSISTPRKSLREIIESREFQSGLGLFLIVFSLYMLLAFFSYLKHWQSDDNAVQNGLSILFDGSVSVENSTGKIGAWLGYTFIKQWFGIGSFLLLIFIANSGLLLLKVRIISFFESVLWLLGSTLWLSVFMSAIFTRPDAMIWGGLFGQQIRLWISAVIGNFGLVVLLLISFAAYVSTIFGFKLHQIRLQKSHHETDDRKTETDVDPQLNNNKTNATETEVNTHEIEEYPQENRDELFQVIEKEHILEIQTNENQIEDALTAENEIELPLTEQNSSHEKESSEVHFVIETQPVLNDNAEPDDENLAHEGLDTIYDPMKDLSSYQFPPTTLLIDRGEGESKVSREELEHNKNRIVETLGNYDIKISQIKATIGPTVTMYEIVPAPGIRISRIKNLEDDIALSLAALGIRIIAPIPGKGTIGIEVPNQSRETVSLRSLLESEKFSSSRAELPFAMGKTITNEPFVADLAKLPHLLIAGATGQGKSVGLNTIICSLLYKKHPSQLKFVFVDPKKVELALFSKIDKHFLAKLPNEEEAIITDVYKVITTLTSLTQLMDTRYDLLKNGGCKNIIEYNHKFLERRLNPENGHHFMPYIVLVIDEFADLIMTAGKEVELPVARIAQLARAVGIHLIVATQRPSVDVITGKIKANFPARIAFKVSSKVDSRTILDGNGADQLIGQGDMLYSHGSTVLRLQCAFVDTPEIENLVDFIGDQQGYPSAFELPEPNTDQQSAGRDTEVKNLDKLFADAARIIVSTQQGSTSLLQTRLTIGFARARRIIEQLEMTGIVGPPQGSKPRDVLVKDLELLEQYLKSLE